MKPQLLFMLKLNAVRKIIRKKQKRREYFHDEFSGADYEARTRYLHLGKVALYQMSYGRISGAFIPAPSRAILANFGVPAKACKARFCGEKEKIWYSSQKSCLQDFPMSDRIFDVVPPIGIEPMTRGFSVPCSTD